MAKEKTIDQKRRECQFAFLHSSLKNIRETMEKRGYDEHEINKQLHHAHKHLKAGFKDGLSVADLYPKECAPAMEWVSVEDDLPPFGEEVLVHRIYNGDPTNDDYYIGWRSNDERGIKDKHLFDVLASGVEITHWMRIPKV